MGVDRRPATNDRSYRICQRCIMDTSDPEIRFDALGICNHCRTFDRFSQDAWLPNDEGARRLKGLLDDVRREGRGREYDSVLGLSGGIDSSFLAYKVRGWGLRPLVVHVDAGWNSELAVKNIEHIVRKLSFDLHTHVIDWEEMRDVQLAFLKSGVANQDIPQDHAFYASLLQIAARHHIRYVLSGNNLATESILPTAWGYSSTDAHHLRAIHRRFGTVSLRTFPTMGLLKYHLGYQILRRMRIIAPLNLIPYDKSEAITILQRELGWRYYGGKHYESRFTKFFQAYWLPTRFGYDKRRAHLSSLIVSGQTTREQAMREMDADLYPIDELAADREFVCKKLGLSVEELEALLHAPRRSYSDYPSNEALLARLRRLRARWRALSYQPAAKKRDQKAHAEDNAA